MKDYHEFCKTVAKLETILEYIGPDSESEACENLVRLHGYPDYVSDEFVEALQKEIEAKIESYNRDYKLVEKEVKTTTWTRQKGDVVWVEGSTKEIVESYREYNGN